MGGGAHSGSPLRVGTRLDSETSFGAGWSRWIGQRERAQQVAAGSRAQVYASKLRFSCVQSTGLPPSSRSARTFTTIAGVLGS